MLKNKIVLLGLIFILFSCTKSNDVENSHSEKEKNLDHNTELSSGNTDKDKNEIIQKPAPELEPEPIITKLTNINKVTLLHDTQIGVVFPDFGYQMGDYIPKKDFGFKYLPENNIIYIESEIETEYLLKLTDPIGNSFKIENLFAEETPYSDATFLYFKFYNYASQTRGVWNIKLFNKETEVESLFDFEVKPHSVTISKEILDSPFIENKTYSLKLGDELNIYINNISEDSRSFQIFENINDEYYEKGKLYGKIYKPILEIECDFVNLKWSGILTIGEDLIGRTFAVGNPIYSDEHLISWTSGHRLYSPE